MAVIRLILGLFLVFLSVEFAGFSDVVGHEPVEATVGEDVVLPCHLEPPFDVSTLTVEWRRDHDIVHLYTNRKDNHDPQDEQFRDRTSLFHDEMKDGNISLKLSNVKKEDSGLYSCYVPKLESQVKRGNVRLTVNPQKDTGERGGDNETEDDKEETDKDQTVVIAGSVVGVVLVLLLVLTGIAVYYSKCRGRNQGHHPQGERGNPVELDRLNSDPDLIPQGAAAQ